MSLAENYHKILSRRYSPRHFINKPVSREVLMEILDTVRYAPSSFNEQPWRFVYALKSDEQAYQALLSCLVEKNQAWAQQAPTLVLAVAKTDFSMTGSPNRHAWYDTGAVVAMMTLKATTKDVFVHQMAGFDAAKAREVLQVPGGYEPVVMIALGYLEHEQKPDKPRRAVEEIAFAGRWQE